MLSERTRSALRGRIRPPSGLPRIYRMGGLFLLVVVLASLGVPLPGALHLLAPISVLIGFGLARSILIRAQYQHWCLPTTVYYLARLYIPVLLVLLMVATFTWTGLIGTGFLAKLDHLWLILTVALTGMFTPILLLTRRQRVGRNRRAVGLVLIALTLAATRIALLLADYAPDLPFATIVIDPMLAGLALGVMPQSMFHRNPVRGWTAPAAAAIIAIVLIEPSVVADSLGVAIPSPKLTNAFLGPLAALCTAILVWSEANMNLRGPFVRLVDLPALTWLADRGVAIYVFHLPFLILVGGAGNLGGSEWPGLGAFAVALALTMAAATICQRSIIDPVLVSLDNLPAETGDHYSIAEQSTTTRRILKGGQPRVARSEPAVLEPMQTITRRPRPMPNPEGNDEQTDTDQFFQLSIDMATKQETPDSPGIENLANGHSQQFPPPLSRDDRDIDLIA